MIETRVLGHDIETGVTEYYHYDHATDEIIIERKQDVTKIVESNKANFNDHAGGWQGDMHHVASIPLELLPILEKKGIINSAGRVLDQGKFRAWLNDRDNRAFRTRPGRV